MIEILTRAFAAQTPVSWILMSLTVGTGLALLITRWLR